MEKLLVDKYRPKTLDTLDYHQELTSQLKKLAKADDFPHLLFYGLNGAGKKTRVMSFIHEVYGANVTKLKSEIKEFKSNSGATIECNIISSNYHLDITPSDNENQDKLVIQSLLKEVATTNQLDQKSQRPFKVVIINQVDELTREAQAALRRTMEKYVQKCRLILICENMGKVLAPLRSRCLMIRVPSPSIQQIEKILINISHRENFNLPKNLATRIANDSDRNLRKAILQLQNCRVIFLKKIKFSNLTDNSNLYKPEWRQAITNISQQVIQEQSPNQLRKIRDTVYDLLINCIPPEMIMKYILLDLLQKVDQNVKLQYLHWTAHHENRMGNKPVFHIEALLARLMFIYKNNLAQTRR